MVQLTCRVGKPWVVPWYSQHAEWGSEEQALEALGQANTAGLLLLTDLI